MATREENIKKINTELEKLSDEELEKVAGGYVYETAADSQWLYIFGKCKHSYSVDDIKLSQSTDKEEEVKAAWAKIGVGYEYSSEEHNKYYIDGKEVSSREAYKRLKKGFML